MYLRDEGDSQHPEEVEGGGDHEWCEEEDGSRKEVSIYNLFMARANRNPEAAEPPAEVV